MELREVEIYGYGENLSSNLAMNIFSAIASTSNVEIKKVVIIQYC